MIYRNCKIIYNKVNLLGGNDLLTEISKLEKFIGHTELVKLESENLDLHCKLEFQNFMGSIKVRPAYYILRNSIESGLINKDTTVIESSSGNFAVALASICKQIGIKFIPVIDPNINKSYEDFLNSFAFKTIKVSERDETGGYLLTRVRTIENIVSEGGNYFWPNQYKNKNNFLAYYHSLGNEVGEEMNDLDYAFIGVSSGGTITGLSRRLKELYSKIKIVAVDIEGSMIFNQKPKKRFIPGIGSSKTPEILKDALIDEVVHVSEIEAIESCYHLFDKHGIFGGGSSGASLAAIKNYFKDDTLTKKPKVLFLCPDSGTSYINTIYNKEWVNKISEEHNLVIS